MKFQYLVLFLMLAPSISFAEVRINEIAWMGTINSANDEWIELYNDGSESVDMSGWTLSAADGSPNIILDGVISSRGYYLLERTDDSSVPTVNADQIYNGVLGNNGEQLFLRDSSGSLQYEVNHAGEWQGGDNITKDTMQYGALGWETGAATPGSQNNDVQTSVSNNEEELEPDNIQDTESLNSLYDPIKDVIDQFKINLHIEPVVISGVATEFSVDVYKNDIRQLRGIHSWNFGDGTFFQSDEIRRKSEMSVHHTYQHPGTYVAIFEYRTSTLKKEPDVRHRVNIVVTRHDVVISSITSNNNITLENKADKEIDIGGWLLETGNKRHVIPINTILLPKSKLTFSQDNTRVPISEQTRLLLPDHSLVASLVKERVVIQKSIAKVNNQSEFTLTDSIRPLRNTATVLYAQEDKGKGDSNVNYMIILLSAVFVAGGLVGVSIFFYKTKTSSVDELEVDDITILEE